MALISTSSQRHPAVLRIELLGPVRLIAGSADGNARSNNQPRRLALLALLADAGEAGISRDRVLGLLWPEVPQQRARHSLDQLLYALRADLGADVIAGGGNPTLSDSTLTCDLWEFEAAVRRQDWAAAVAAYGGPFLDGFFAGVCEQFDHWADARRAALERQWLHALEARAAEVAVAGDAVAALHLWTRLATQDPLSSRYALGLMKAMAATGDSVGALRHASIHAALVAGEVGAEPDSSVLQYAEELRVSGNGRGASSASQPVLVAPPNLAASYPGEAPAPASGRARLLRFAVAPVLLAITVVLAAWWSQRDTGAGGNTAGPSVRSLAVLPFENFGLTDSQYLGDALADELISELAKVSGIYVAARTSAFSFKGNQVPVDEIGRRLGVAHVLEGSVQHAGGRVRVSARLVAAQSGYQLWAETYDVSAPDLFDVQIRIARGIAAVLEVTLTSGGAAPPTHNVEAYDLYLRGRTLYLSAAVRDKERTQRALDYLTRASALDPGFAAAHAGLADVYSRLGDVERARAAALEALRLDSTLVEAHASLAYVLAYHERNWRAGFREIDRAIELGPSYAPAYLRRSNMRAARGEFDAALADVAHALRLDPLSVPARMNEALVYFWAGRYSEALPRVEDLLARDSTDNMVRLTLALTYFGLGRSSEAAAEFRRLGFLNAMIMAEGNPLRMDSVRRSVEADLQAGKSSPSPALAAIYVQLGMADSAIAALERQLAPPHSANLVFLIWWPPFRRLHSHPGFERVYRAVFPTEPLRPDPLP